MKRRKRLLARRSTLVVTLLWVVALGTSARAFETQSQLGPVTALVTLTPDEPVIGDRLQLLIEVRAAEGVEVLMPEFGEVLDRFDILDFVPREALDDSGATLFSQRYTLAPPMSGEHTLPSLLIEFVDRRPGRDPAPEGQAAYELLTEPLTFEITSVVPAGATAELSPVAGRLAPRSSGGGMPWAWIAVAGLGIAAAAPFAWRAVAAWRTRARRQSAYEIAQGELAQLHQLPRSSEAEIDAFFVRLSDIVRHYLERRFGVRSPEYTTEEFLARISGSPDLSRSHQRLLVSFLEQADLVKFAHHLPAPEGIEASLQSVARFVEETREAPSVAPLDQPVAAGAG